MFEKQSLCSEGIFCNTDGIARDVLPRVRHRLRYNYLLERWIWETEKRFVKLYSEFSLGKDPEDVVWVSPVFSGLYFISSWALAQEALSTWSFLVLSLSSFKNSQNLALCRTAPLLGKTHYISGPMDSRTPRRHPTQLLWCCTALRASCPLVHPGFEVFLDYIVAVITSRCHLKGVSKGLLWHLEQRVAILLLFQGLCYWTVSCLFTGCNMEMKKTPSVEGNGCTDVFLACLFWRQYPKYGQHFLWKDQLRSSIWAMSLKLFILDPSQ